MPLFFSALLLSIAASSDCLVIGLNYGAKGIRITKTANLFMAAICFAGTYFSMLAGVGLALLIPAWVESLVGGLILILLGGYMLWGALRPHLGAVSRSDPHQVDADQSKAIELRESLGISLLLCINNIGIGIGGSVAGVDPLLTSLLCAFFSVLFIGLGNWTAGRFARTPAKLLEIGSAGILILLGLYSLLQI
ncbi:hypothetical protein U6B65_06250 [Oscillospiraceae bacterium MB08-C2-2]|nr:hypothetical protein U6B65_06250 [Oscillospiraceae bacterium MB08-C2-2]